jgi:hypothetical protein
MTALLFFFRWKAASALRLRVASWTLEGMPLLARRFFVFLLLEGTPLGQIR